jgi:hypothetical protein
MKECKAIHQRGLDFASNYTAMLVGLHNVFNGDAAGLYATISQVCCHLLRVRCRLGVVRVDDAIAYVGWGAWKGVELLLICVILRIDEHRGPLSFN